MRVYFDYNATTPLAQEVIDAVARATRDIFGNASRSTFVTLSWIPCGVRSRTNVPKVPRGSDCKTSVSIRSFDDRYLASSSLLAMRIAQLATASNTGAVS